MAMKWKKLLSKTRFSSNDLDDNLPIQRSSSPVTVFQDDAERIIFSTAFRRLQGKTQVYPFPNFDYLRTRLTHTVEVANVGRVIANGIAKVLAENGHLKKREFRILAILSMRLV